jgi:hypothetical protein
MEALHEKDKVEFADIRASLESMKKYTPPALDFLSIYKEESEEEEDTEVKSDDSIGHLVKALEQQVLTSEELLQKFRGNYEEEEE